MLRVQATGHAWGLKPDAGLQRCPGLGAPLPGWGPVFAHVRAAASPADTFTHGQNEGENHFRKRAFQQKSSVPQV